MPDLQDGESIEVQGSARLPYVLKNVGGVYSCTCPAWRNQSVAIERRTCKHLRKLRGEAAEKERLGADAPTAPVQEKDPADAGPGLLLAQNWENDVELSGWWLSEKLDGVRAYWDGKQFLSRQGNTFHAPDWFVEALPAEPLDGELWLGRKAFQRTVSIVRRQDKSDLWKEIKYLVFDMPAIAAPFEERMAALRDRLASKPSPHAAVHEQYPCRGLDHLREELTWVEALGGEGLMLREPGSLYVPGRSTTLLKVKTFHDAEARVVEHLPGAGRHKGRLGALAVELPDGTAFSVGTGFSDAQRNNPPPVGSTITFRYQELSDRGVPRFPSFVRLRQEASDSIHHAPRDDSPPEVRKDRHAPPATAPKSTPVAARYFEFVEGNSSKFWEITVSNTEVTVRYGRIGTTGQSKAKTFGDAAAAQSYADKLIVEKTEKGYEEKTTA
ncbi:MAG: DNA ligase [Planctomycetes bacterium]|nr:DNA ligase [Planctomycetota bacterium]